MEPLFNLRNLNLIVISDYLLEIQIPCLSFASGEQVRKWEREDQDERTSVFPKPCGASCLPVCPQGGRLNFTVVQPQGALPILSSSSAVLRTWSNSGSIDKVCSHSSRQLLLRWAWKEGGEALLPLNIVSFSHQKVHHC